MKFSLLINMNSCKQRHFHAQLCLARKNIYLQLLLLVIWDLLALIKLHAQLSWARETFYNLLAWFMRTVLCDNVFKRNRYMRRLSLRGLCLPLLQSNDCIGRQGRTWSNCDACILILTLEVRTSRSLVFASHGSIITTVLSTSLRKTVCLLGVLL